jgi:putative endonuclease
MQRWYTYILHLSNIDKYDVGVIDDLQWRLGSHHAARGRFTKVGIPWKIVYYESFTIKTEALSRGKEIKSKKSRSYTENLIRHAGDRPAPNLSYHKPVNN